MEIRRTQSDPAIVLPVTGWQGNDGGQGEWNQPFGPDPHTNQYGTDPYSAGSPGGGYDPYAQADPQAQYPGYQTGGFPAQGYPPTSGFPAQGYGPPPPPPKRSKLPMILSLVAIVIIVGAVVAIVVVNRKDTGTATPRENETSAPSTSSAERSDPTSKSGSPTSTGGGTEHDGWVPVDNTADAGLSYQVPPDWKPSSTTRTSGLDVDFTGNADYGIYDCEGANYVRTFAASGDVQGKGGKDLDLAATMEDFAKGFASSYYGSDAKVELSEPVKADVEGREALKLMVTVTPVVTKPACQATSGEIGLVGVQLETDGQPKGVAMLVVVNDLAGGPAEPKPLPTSVTEEILATVKAG